jgi:hypothetical protein
MSTVYHSQYSAHALTLSGSGGDIAALSRAIANASYGDLTYEQKRPHYNGQNILARTLCDKAYDHNPGLKQFITRTGVDLHPHAEFKKADLETRQALYLDLAKRVWDPALIIAECAATEVAANGRQLV